MKTTLMFFISICLLASACKTFGQNNWIVQNSNTTNTLWGVYFTDFYNGWIAGEHDLVLHTTNGGSNWAVQSTPDTATLFSVYFSTATNGVACGFGGTILHTTNGGSLWEKVPPITTLQLRNINFVNSNTGWIAGGNSNTSVILKTTNGGANWISQSNCSIVGLKGVFFINSSTGWCSSWLITKTTDGGSSWQCSPDTVELESISYASPMVGYMAGYEDYVTKTIDGGNTWVKKYPSMGTDLMAVYAAPDLNTVFISGRYGFIAKSSDGGNSWQNTLNGVDEDMNMLSFINATTGTVVGGNGKIFRTTNGGTSIYYTVSGLVNFQDNNQPVTSGYVKAISFDSATFTITTIDSAQIQLNGSYMMSHIPPHITFDIMAFENDEAQLSFVPTYYPSTTNWQNATSLTLDSSLTSINVLVYRISNPGGSLHIAGHITKLSQNPYVGLYGAIVYAKLGNLYQAYSISDNNGAYRIDSLSAGSYNVIVDRMGFREITRPVNLIDFSKDTIDFTMDNLTGLESQNQIIPKNYWLGANYPNPFNPETKIKFGIPNNVKVVLTIYDILGREVARPVNEELKAGIYSVNWDASNYSSGIYFYKLQAGDFVQTKKMVLIK